MGNKVRAPGGQLKPVLAKGPSVHRPCPNPTHPSSTAAELAALTGTVLHNHQGPLAQTRHQLAQQERQRQAAAQAAAQPPAWTRPAAAAEPEPTTTTNLSSLGEACRGRQDALCRRVGSFECALGCQECAPDGSRVTNWLVRSLSHSMVPMAGRTPWAFASVQQSLLSGSLALMHRPRMLCPAGGGEEGEEVEFGNDEEEEVLGELFHRGLKPMMCGGAGRMRFTSRACCLPHARRSIGSTRPVSGNLESI